MDTGPRSGEICVLLVADIDQLNRRMLVRRTWSGKRLEERTKGKRANWVPLSERAWEIIAPRLTESDATAFIFQNPRARGQGKAFRPKILNQTWQRYSGLALCFHAAGRHSFCTQIVDDGTNPFLAQELMRHADQRTTRGYYHASSEKHREALNRRGQSSPPKVVPIRKAK